MKECIICDLSFYENKSGMPDKYFIQLPGFTLKPLSNFFIDQGKYYISYGYDVIPIDNSLYVQSEKIKEVSVRMMVDEASFLPATSLLVPVNKKTYQFVSVILDIFPVPLIIFSLLACIILPAITIFSIASGKPFTKRNIGNLRFSGWVFITMSLLPVLGGLISKLVLINKLSNEIIFPFWLSIYENRGWLIAGFVCLLLADAFKSGYEMKKEQDLTI